MKVGIAHLVSTAAYSPSRNYEHDVPRKDRERPEDYDLRTWRNHCHTMSDGKVFMPPMAFKQALDAAASMLGMKMKGQKTYTKFFLSGVLCMEPVILPYTMEDAACDRIFANADGKRGSGKRVWRHYPRFDSWEAKVPFHVLADEISEKVFEEHLRQAGSFIGVGRFRPQNGGYYGRFEVKKIKWN